ncbi:MAG: MFS transporter [Lachnospiraceae bacterium]|nr:MFS transporter [Lachnospiraceae bacterium]
MKRTKSNLIFLVCYLAYTSIYIGRLNFSMASPGLKESFVLTQEQVGMIGSVFFVVYALGRVVNGYIGDRVSPWIMMSLGLLIAGASNLLIGFLPPFIGILLLWGSNAYAQSMLWSSLTRTVSEIYEYEKAKKMMSYMISSVAAGNILAILVCTGIIGSLGLSFAFIVPGAILLVFCLAVLLTVSRVKCKPVQSNHLPMKELVKDKRIHSVALPTLFHGMIKDNISLWMTLFFMAQYNIDLEASAYFILLIPVVGLAGRMAYPFICRFYKEREYKIASHGFLVCIVAALLLLIKVPPIVAMIALSLIYAAVSIINGVFLSAFPLQFAATGNQASVSGIMDFFNYFGAAVGSLVFGFITEHFGYSSMFLTYALVSVISVIIIERKVIKKAN